MNILNWFFGKKTLAVPPAADSNGVKGAATEKRPATPVPERRNSVDWELENLRRWRESGQARTWVEAHQGSWNHEDWLKLLDDLQRSSFWPMQPDAVGLVLEDTKREWLQRN